MYIIQIIDIFATPPPFLKMIFFPQVQWKFPLFPLFCTSYPLYSRFLYNQPITHIHPCEFHDLLLRFKEYEDWLVESSASGKGKPEALKKEKEAQVRWRWWLSTLDQTFPYLHQRYDGKRQRPDRVKKSFDLIPVDLVTDFRFSSWILWKWSKKYAAFSKILH